MGKIIQEVLPAIMMAQLKDDTDKDPKLKKNGERKTTRVHERGDQQGPIWQVMAGREMEKCSREAR